MKKSMRDLLEEGNSAYERSWFIDDHFFSFRPMGWDEDYYDAVIRDGFILTAPYDFKAPETKMRYVCLPHITAQAYAEYQGNDGVEFLKLCLNKARDEGLLFTGKRR